MAKGVVLTVSVVVVMLFVSLFVVFHLFNKGSNHQPQGTSLGRRQPSPSGW